MSRVWRTLKGYLFWTYDRGSFHYDVMVTLILIFIFAAPRFINFKDRAAENRVRAGEITVTSDARQGLIYQVDAAQVDAQDMGMVRRNFQNLLQPMIGGTPIERVEPVRDDMGRIVAYRAWVRK
ncbi:MAG TPA: hypothetical protein VKW06_18810 [Candidatus Angelobacter sp.]|nr:hypothetical protein [Candidatus Angelobacter sp.]